MARKRRRRRRRRRKNPDTATMLLLLAGGGAAAYYFLVHKKKAPVVPVPQPTGPSLTDAVGNLIGGLLGSLGSKTSPAQAAQNVVQATGDPAAVGKLDAARAAGKKFFVFQSHKGAPAKCIDVATGKSVAITNCPSRKFLEGMGATGVEYGRGRGHSLSSRGYGSLR